MANPRAGRPANSSANLRRKNAVLIPMSHVTARVNGGKLNVIGSPVRRTDKPLSQFYSFDGGNAPYDSGTGTTGKLRCPAASTALTAKITLSFEIFRVARVTFPKLC